MHVPKPRTYSKTPLSKLSLSIPCIKFEKSRSYFRKLKEKQERTTKARTAENLNLNEKTEKFSATCPKSSKSILKPNYLKIAEEEEEILNVIRVQNPKAEIRNSPLLSNSRAFSPTNFNIEEDFDEYKADLRNQRARYRKLETLYNELLNKNSAVEKFYKGIADEINEKMNKCSKEDKQKKAKEIMMEVIDIKESLKAIVMRIEGVTHKIKDLM